MVATEDYVGRGILFQVGREGGEVGVEVGGCGGEGGEGGQALIVDGDEETALGGGGDQLIEGILELFGDGDAGLHGELGVASLALSDARDRCCQRASASKGR